MAFTSLHAAAAVAAEAGSRQKLDISQMLSVCNGRLSAFSGQNNSTLKLHVGRSNGRSPQYRQYKNGSVHKFRCLAGLNRQTIAATAVARKLCPCLPRARSDFL